MVVTDLGVQCAEPLVFLDYLAMDELDPETAKAALRGVAEGCRRAGCTLLGGETASMPGVYTKGDVELVGFGVGVVEREQLIDGSSISQGDAILGLASSGCHSNGYSLVRSIVDAGLHSGQLELRAEVEELNTSLASALLTPTRIYVKPVLNVMRDFAFLQQRGKLSEDEMLRVFNCGIGMILIVAREQAEDVIDRLQALGERATRIGEIEAKQQDEPAILFAPPSQQRG